MLYIIIIIIILYSILGLFLAKCKILHLSVLKGSNHSLDQSTSLFKSFLRITLSYPVLLIFVSSANICTCEVIDNGRSFIKIVNSNGPRTLPWGIPEVTSDQFEHIPMGYTLLFAFCVIKKSIIHNNMMSYVSNTT